MAAEVPEGLVRARVAGVLREEGAELDVCEAEIAVSGGRGLEGSENFALLRDLAAVLPRAAVGASGSADAEIDQEPIFMPEC